MQTPAPLDGPTRRTALLAALAAPAVWGTASAQGTPIRIGVMAPFSGGFADYGRQFRQAIDVYLDRNGPTVAGRRIEVLYRDLPESNPSAARALAQELVVREHVSYLGGIVFTPNALAIAPLVEEARVPLVIFNAATSAILDRSRYLLRTSYTLPQVTVPAAQYALERGLRRAVTAVSDYAPGVDAETAFKRAFEGGGGAVVDSLRMPLRSTDFAPYMQRVRAAGEVALYVFLPAGPPTVGMVKAYVENGLRAAGIAFIGTAETQETDLPAIGDAALGLETAFHYSAVHDSDENRAFAAALTRLHPGAVPNFSSVGAYDGMHVIARMIEATGGASDAAKAVEAVKGTSWESPRGPVSINANRDLVQNVYMRRVERAPGGLVNREFRTFPAVPDSGRTAPAG